jgi:flagellar biosynthesis/type III secretory pathway chaperone
MSEFKRLLSVLEKELAYHEKLLEVLNSERAAIVTLNPEQIEKLNAQKEEILIEARQCENRRRELIREIGGVSSTTHTPSAAEIAAARAQKAPAKPAEPVFSEIIRNCTQSEIRRELTKVGADLRATAETVREMNNHNAQLIKQSLGLISSTLSIIRSTPGSELPTYGQRGELRDSVEDPAFSGRSRGLAREA